MLDEGLALMDEYDDYDDFFGNAQSRPECWWSKFDWPSMIGIETVFVVLAGLVVIYLSVVRSH
jgi:hypothetical protein